MNIGCMSAYYLAACLPGTRVPKHQVQSIVFTMAGSYRIERFQGLRGISE